jgi:hypothetical protein
MPGDAIVAKRTPTPLHPKGLQQAVCVDVIDLGENVEQFQKQEAKLVHKIAFVFETKHTNPVTGKPWELSREMPLSLGKKATLRKWIGDWRGSRVTQDEADEGIELIGYVGENGLLSVEHAVSEASERTYAKITNIAPLMDGMELLSPSREYERSAWWSEKQDEYAAATAKFKRARGEGPERPIAEVLAEADDDLPF